LEAVRQEAPDCRFYQASSSEQMGNSAVKGKTRRGYNVQILNEDSPMIPRSPYGAAKLFAHNMVRNYREAYGMFAVGNILFNHEHPLRGTEFVTRKITHTMGEILSGKNPGKIMLGNLESMRDWSNSEDSVYAMYLTMQQVSPKDYVIASGETYSVRDFVKLAFLCVGILNWERYIEQDPELIRPSEVDLLIGDSSRAKAELGWEPKHTFVDLVYEMVQFDLGLNGVNALLRPKEEVQAQWTKWLKNNELDAITLQGVSDHG
jgi:GDPmannose 4,6-dehydratase